MEKPIDRRRHPYPKDFNISPSKQKKATKQYTFNKESLLSDSMTDFDEGRPYTKTPF